MCSILPNIPLAGRAAAAAKQHDTMRLRRISGFGIRASEPPPQIVETRRTPRCSWRGRNSVNDVAGLRSEARNRPGSRVEAEATEFFLWVERHTRRCCPPHQSDFLRGEPVSGVDEIGKFALKSEHVRGRFASHGQRVGMLLLESRDLRRGKLSALRQSGAYSSNERVCVAQMSAVVCPSRFPDCGRY